MVALNSVMNLTSGQFRKCMNRIAVLTLLTSSIIFVSCSINKNLFQTITPAEGEEVKKICSNLKHPPSFIKIEKKKDLVRSNLASSAYVFRSTDSPKDIEKYYIDQLSKTGWNPKRELIGNSLRLRLKKDKYSI